MVLGLSSMSLTYAQDSGSTGAAGSERDQGGTTGQMTTTPEAKTDDAAGTRGPAAGPAVAAPGGLESGAGHGCTATQMWDPAKKECVDQ